MKQEEKAKAYDEALERAKANYELNKTMGFLNTSDIIANIFPQLRESEDERIRKIITDSVFYQYGAGAEYKDVLDYLDKLEKQKENPKSADSIPSDCTSDAKVHPQSKQEWSEADETYLQYALWCVEKAEKSCKDGEDKGACWSARRWLKSLRPQSKQEWSKEDENALKYLHELISFGYTEKFFDAQTAADMREWLNTRLKAIKEDKKWQR